MRTLVVMLLAMLSLGAGASAATPGNDDVVAATGVVDLPFVDSIDTADATSATGDLRCSGLEDTHTVWYTITPSTDGLLGLRTEPSFSSEVSTAVATGSPGALTFLQCDFTNTQSLRATAGTTYYIQIASAGPDPGGVIAFSVEEVEPLVVFLDLARNARIEVEPGLLTLSGTLRCSRPLPPGSEVVIQGTLRQGSASGWLVPFHSEMGCPTTPLRWETTVQVMSGSFARGWASLTGTAFACDAFTCAPNDMRPARVRLR